MFTFFDSTKEIEILESPITKTKINSFLGVVQLLLDKKPLQKENVIRANQILMTGLNKIYKGCTLDQWKEFILFIQSHPLKNILHECPYTKRIFLKPRGYAGDAVVLDYIYFGISNEELPNITERGQMIFDANNQTPPSRAVRNRARKIGSIIDNLPLPKTGKLRIFSIACGHVRELSTSKRFMRGECEVVALDQDNESLSFVKKEYGHLGVQTLNAKIKKLLMDKDLEKQLGEFDLVYASGLFDYLNDEICRLMMEKMYSFTREGGRTLFTNFLTNIECRAFMESFMEWDLIYRSAYDLLKLAENIIPSGHGQFYEESSQNIVFLEYRKPLAHELQTQLTNVSVPLLQGSSDSNMNLMLSHKSKL